MTGCARLAMEWLTAQGAVDEQICVVPLIGCYRIRPHREGWLQLSLESRAAGPRVLVVSSDINDLFAFATSHARLMMETNNDDK